MGFFDKILKKENDNDNKFLEIVKANDDGEEWAQEIISQRWKQEPNLLDKIARARIQLYSNAAHQGDETAQYYMGLAEGKLGNAKESYKWLYRLANNGNVKAMSAIAMQYSELGCYGYDKEKEFEWNLKAAEAGDADSQCRVALEYSIDGKEMEALNWYAKAAQQSSSKGCLGYGKTLSTMKLKYYKNYSKEKLEEMQTEIEDAYIDAINLAKNRDDYSSAASALGYFYMFTDVKRSVYFLYRAYEVDNDRQGDYNEALELCREHGIDINSVEKIGEELFGD